MTKNNINKFINWVVFISFLTILFTNYQFFWLIAIIVLLTSLSNKEFVESKIKYLKTLPYIFYFIRYLFSLSENFDTLWKNISTPNYFIGARFVDLQQVLVSLKCNYDDIQEYNLLFSYLYKSCPWSAKYGPLLEVIPYFGNIWRDTLILSFCLLLSTLLLYKNLLKEHSEYEIVIVLLL